MPEFLKQGYYFRMWYKDEEKWNYFYAAEVEKPLTYTYNFPSTAYGSEATQKNFKDINPAEDIRDGDAVKYRYFYQCFLGVAHGFRYKVWHPYDSRMLKWHEALADVPEDETAYIDHDKAPYDNPSFEIWVRRDQYFGLVPKNVITSRESKKPSVKIWAEEIKAIQITDKELIKNLGRIGGIPCYTVVYGAVN